LIELQSLEKAKRPTSYLAIRSDFTSVSSDARSQMAADFAQDALLLIQDKLDTFRGESQFTTWAAKVAVHLAFNQLQRKHWADRSLEEFTQEGEFEPAFLVTSGGISDPAAEGERSQLMATLTRVIQEELTERQRMIMMATVVEGVPLDELARRLGTNRNALYKLMHDARKRLKARLLAQGLAVEDFMATFQVKVPANVGVKSYRQLFDSSSNGLNRPLWPPL